MHAPSQRAWQAVADMLRGDDLGRPIILDAGCGTGESVRAIAAANPDRLVIGVDRSRHRLGKTGHSGFPALEGNILWVRAELETFWRLAASNGWKLERHYLLYPNPYPKRSQLVKRWHAHPVWPAMLALGGTIEMRSNWLVYAEEFARALEISTGKPISVEGFEPGQALTAFERKYHASGHRLYRVVMPGKALEEFSDSGLWNGQGQFHGSG